MITMHMGFANKLILKCMSCKWKNDMFTSNGVTQPTKKQGRKMFEVNIRSIIAFREIGFNFVHPEKVVGASIKKIK